MVEEFDAEEEEPEREILEPEEQEDYYEGQPQEQQEELISFREMIEIDVSMSRLRIASSSCDMSELVNHSKKLKKIFFNNHSAKEKSYYG